MQNTMKKTVSLLLTVCMLGGICLSTVGLHASTAEAAALSYTDSAPVLSGVTLTKSNKTSTMLQSYTSDQGETVYNENYSYTYPVYAATFGSTVSLTGSTNYVDHIKSGHPRLFVEDFGVYIERADSDYMSKQFYNNVIKAANNYLNVEPYVFYMNIRDNINDFCGNIQSRIAVLAMAYNLEKKKTELGRADAVTDYEKYADRAIAEMLNAAKYPHWSQDAYLCTAEISVGFALGYDWLYDYLMLPKNAEALTTIKDTIYEMSIVPYAYQYSKKSYWGTNNWNEVCNSSGIVTAIAFYDGNDTGNKFSTLCEYILESAAHYLHEGLVQYQDGGFFREGIGYWGYATEYLTRGIAAYQGALADNFVLPARFRHIEVQGVAETPEFPIYMNGITGVLNFGDCSGSMVISWIMYWFADQLDKPEYASYMNNYLQLYGKTFSDEDAVCALLWYVPQQTDFTTLSKLPLDKMHVSEDDINILTMRSDFEVNTSHTDNVFVGMQGGDISAGHIGMSLGSFVLDMNGKRFVKTLGAGNYVWPGYFSTSTVDSPRYTYYCMRGEGNNTLIVDPGYSGEQSKSSFVKLIDSGTSANTAFGVMDLTSTNDKFDKYYRGIMITDNRRRVVVQDEIKATAAAGAFKDVYWFAHTGDPENGGADVVISDDGKSAILTIGNQSIVAKITRGMGTFEWVDAEPLPSSPNPEIQHARMEKYGKKLRIHMTNIISATIRVEFSPLGMETENVPYAALADWDTQLSDEVKTVDVDTYISTNNYETDWYDASYSTYYIHDDKDLAGLAYMVNSGTDFAGKTVKLVNNITMDPDLQWTPIGTDTKPFKGTFDGSQKTIDGLYYNLTAGKHAGLFGCITNATVKNVLISNAQVAADSDAGALAGIATNSEIYNVFTDECLIRGNMRLGGIVGTLIGGSIKNCGMSGKVFGQTMYYGGITGYLTGVVDNCVANVQMSEFTKTITTATKTIIKVNESGALEKTVETTVTTVEDATGAVTGTTVSVTEPEIVTEGEVGETTTTSSEVQGIGMGKLYGGIVGLSAYGDVKNSYYVYTRLYIPSGCQPLSGSSVNRSNSCGKFTGVDLTVSNIASSNSVLGYIGKGKSLPTVLGAWIADQENASDYISWQKHTPSFGWAASLNFVPETVVDVNNNKDLFEISDVTVESGKVSFNVVNKKYAANTGYLVIVQTAADGTVTTKLTVLNLDENAVLPVSIDAVNGAKVKIFVLDSFLTMKIKSNIVEL